MRNRGELSKHWLIIIGSAVGIGAGVTGIPFYTLGFFVEPLQQEYGWSRAQIQGMFSVFVFTGIFAAPVIGWLIDRYGIKRVVLPSLFGTALAYLCLGYLTSSLATFYISAGLLAILGSGTTPITWTKAISGWFDRQRGIALGLTLSGTGVAAILAPKYVSIVMDQFGWREAYLGLALIPLLSIPIVWVLFKNPPLKNSDSTNALANQNASGLTVKEATQNYRFWLMAIAFFIVSIAIAGTIPNLVPLLTDTGIARPAAASAVGLLGVSVILGRVVAGLALDRLWAPGVAAALLILPAVSAIILSQQQIPMLQATVAISLIGLAAGAEFDLIAYLVSRYFGLAHYGKIYGLQYVAFALGSGIAPPIFASFYDLQGSYANVMILTAGLFVFGSSLLLLMGKHPETFPASKSTSHATSQEEKQ